MCRRRLPQKLGQLEIRQWSLFSRLCNHIISPPPYPAKAFDDGNNLPSVVPLTDALVLHATARPGHKSFLRQELSGDRFPELFPIFVTANVASGRLLDNY
jgi:hypothetical protein